MTKTISVRRLRENLAGVLDGVSSHFDRYVISKRGKPAAIIMCVDDYEGWLETLAIMSSREVMNDIRIAKKELKEGKFHTFDEVFGCKQKRTKRSS